MLYEMIYFDKQYFVGVLYVIFFSAASVCSKVTDRQYASMPVLFHFDDYDKCMSYDKESLYCMLSFQLYPADPNNTSEIWNIIKKVSSNPSNYRHDLLRHGVCITERCPHLIKNYTLDKGFEKLTRDISECYGEQFKDMQLRGEIVKITCENQESPYPLNNYDIGLAIFVACYLALVLFASLYEGTARYKSAEEYQNRTDTPFGRFISAFALAKNWYRLKTINWDNPDVVALRSIQGVRFYNMICVILMHTVMMNLAVPTINPKYTETMTEKVLNILLANGGFAVQTFFMLSGWLLTYFTLVHFEGKDKISPKFIVLAFINRYLRLTPTFALILAFHCSSWYPRLSRGPFWDQMVGEEYRRCKENWWTNLLYINNYVNRERMCLPQTWYLAIDTQYFIITLVCLWLAWNYKIKISSIVATIIGINVITLFTIIYWNNWESTLRPTAEHVYAMLCIDLPKWHILLGSAYSNLAGLATGLGYGYVFYKYRHTEMFTTKFQVTVWWILVWGLGLGIVVIPGIIMYDPHYEHIRLFAAIYGSTSRIVFAFAVGLGILGFTKGVGWMAKWTCEWYPTYILGRLSYSAFLVHTAYARARAGSRRTPTFLADHMMFSDLLADIFSAFILATLLTLFVELPVSELQKILIPKPRVAKKDESQLNNNLIINNNKKIR